MVLDDDIKQVLSQVRKISESSAERLNTNTVGWTTEDQYKSQGNILGPAKGSKASLQQQNNFCADIERTDSLEFTNNSGSKMKGFELDDMSIAAENIDDIAKKKESSEEDKMMAQS